MIARSLRRKLLVNNGKRLSRIERHLLRAINRNGQREEDGWVSATAFEDALAADGKANRGGSAVTRDEALWLSDKLESRSGKKIACLRIRSLLAADDEESLGIRGHKGRGGGDGDGGDNGWRRRVNISTGAAEEGSNSDTWEHDSGGACSIRRRRDGVARWAVRCGTVGQWLQEVASPMVSPFTRGCSRPSDFRKPWSILPAKRSLFRARQRIVTAKAIYLPIPRVSKSHPLGTRFVQ